MSARQDEQGQHTGNTRNTQWEVGEFIATKKRWKEGSPRKFLRRRGIHGTTQRKDRDIHHVQSSELWQHPSQIHTEIRRRLRQCSMQKAGLTHLLFPPHAQLFPSLSISSCPLNLCPVTRKQRFKETTYYLQEGSRMACTHGRYPTS